MIEPNSLNIFSIDFVELIRKECLPEKQGIYFVTSDNRVLYIGKAANFRTRWINHHRYTQLLDHKNVRIYWLNIQEENNLLTVESLLIKHFEPSLNRTPIEDISFKSKHSKDTVNLKYKITLIPIEPIEGAIEIELKRILGETCRTVG